jgi:large subunit ribosomal protein L3
VSLGLLGNKIGMTQIFDQKGEVIAVTIIKAGPCFITQLKSYENCGYNSIQIGYLEQAKKKVTKPNLGHFEKVYLSPFRYLKEYKIISKTDKNEQKDVFENYKIGQKLDVEMFQIGQKITISGLTIGKGNTGNIKRHNFQRGPMGHGSKHHRLQGSIGSGTTPGRVYPGKRMPGRVGMEKRTISNLTILDIDKKENLLVVKGCIPGKPGNFVTIKV